MGGAGAALEDLCGDEGEVGGEEEGDGEAARGKRQVRLGQGQQDAARKSANLNTLTGA